MLLSNGNSNIGILNPVTDKNLKKFEKTYE
jgi:hypothetical protein